MGRLTLRLGFVIVAVVIIAVVVLNATQTAAIASDSRIQQGFDIAPVLLDLEGKNRAQVGLGS